MLSRNHIFSKVFVKILSRAHLASGLFYIFVVTEMPSLLKTMFFVCVSTNFGRVALFVFEVEASTIILPVRSGVIGIGRGPSSMDIVFNILSARGISRESCRIFSVFSDVLNRLAPEPVGYWLILWRYFIPQSVSVIQFNL